MKKIASLVIVVCVFLFGSVAFAGGGRVIKEVKPKIAIKAGYDLIYEIGLPYDVNDRHIVESVRNESWYCGDNKAEVKTMNIDYNYAQRIPDLSKYNVNTVNISGIGYSRNIENFYGYLYLKPEEKTALITIATQTCGQSFSTKFDSNTGTHVCAVEEELACNDIYFYPTAGGNVILTVEPYLRVITVR